MRKIQRYGWIPDLPDHRDYKFRVAEPIVLPTSVDLTQHFPAVYDQGQLGSCTANGIAGALEFDQIKQGEPEATPSRLFIYYQERVIEGTVSSDSGAMIRDGIKSVNSDGAPPETDWPYDISSFTEKPPDKAYDDATHHKTLLYHSVDNSDITQIKSALASGFPVVFGFSVYDYFESQEFAKDWILHLPQPSEGMLGGHCVCAVGYDDSKSLWIARNSWGSSWGNNGYFWIDYPYLTNTDLASDFWIISQIE